MRSKKGPGLRTECEGTLSQVIKTKHNLMLPKKRKAKLCLEQKNAHTKWCFENHIIQLVEVNIHLDDVLWMIACDIFCVYS